MASVMGLLEAREADARVVVEELRAEADRVLVALKEAEAVLERRVITLAELAEALSAPGQEVEDPGPPVPAAAKVPVAGSVVPHWCEGMTASVLAPDYQRIVDLLGAQADGAGLRAKELVGRLGLEAVPAKVEGVRSKAKRLVERGWLAEERPGVFTLPRPAAVAAG